MPEATINQILAIEKGAMQLRAEVEAEAQKIVAAAQQEADSLREEILAEARKKAVQIKEQGREAAEETREQLLTQAQSEADQMRARAERYFDAAVALVMAHVVGRAK